MIRTRGDGQTVCTRTALGSHGTSPTNGLSATTASAAALLSGGGDGNRGDDSSRCGLHRAAVRRHR
eukprot:3653267-Pleurochrysis_carterae.AAC.10